jgi:uncharacterized membrane protein YfcA
VHLQLGAVLACAAIFVGALTQRMTGLGFALVAAPLLIVVAGPVEGVLLGNALSAVLCVTVLATSWRFVRWGRALLMLAPALLTVPLGAVVALRVPTAPLLVIVGTIAVVAVGMAAMSNRFALLPGRGGAVVAGALSGFMNATAGIGGPMLAVHASSARWPRDVFVGTGQLFLLGLNILSLSAKGLPSISPALWIWSLVALAVGALAGNRLSARVPERLGRPLVLGLAGLGSIVAVIRGLSMM